MADKYKAPASSHKPRIPMGKPRHGPLSAHKRGAGHPASEHKKGGYRMTGDGKKLPMSC